MAKTELRGEAKMIQEAKEVKVLQLMTEACNSDPSFVDYLREMFQRYETRESLLDYLNGNFEFREDFLEDFNEFLEEE